MKMSSLAIPALGLVAALAIAVLTVPFPRSAWSAGIPAPLVSDANIHSAAAPEATAGWFNDQSGSNDYHGTSALDETDAVLATYATGLSTDSIHDDKNEYDFSDGARLVIPNNSLSSNRFGISPTAGWSGFGVIDSYLRETGRAWP